MNKLTPEQSALAARFYTDAKRFAFKLLRAKPIVGVDPAEVAGLAVVIAAGSFDASKGATFATHLYIQVRGQISRARRANEGAGIHGPQGRGAVRAIGRIGQAGAAYRARTGQEPDAADLAEEIGSPDGGPARIADVAVALEYCGTRIVSLDAPKVDGEGNQITRLDTLAGDSDPEAEAVINIQADAARNRLSTWLAALPTDKAARIEWIARRRADGCTLQEIGDELGLTRERVRQILADVLHVANRAAKRV